MSKREFGKAPSPSLAWSVRPVSAEDTLLTYTTSASITDNRVSEGASWQRVGAGCGWGGPACKGCVMCAFETLSPEKCRKKIRATLAQPVEARPSQEAGDGRRNQICRDPGPAVTGAALTLISGRAPVWRKGGHPEQRMLEGSGKRRAWGQGFCPAHPSPVRPALQAIVN